MRSNPPNNPVNATESVDHLFRHHAGRMTAVLSRIFGLGRIDLIEDSIQEAMIRALKLWPFSGIPEKPEAWLIAVARNRVIDQLRRDERSEPVGERDFESSANVGTRFAHEIGEDILRMMFACCNPAISPDSQVALTLKVVSGFSVREIAAAFLAAEDATARMISRAKERLRRTELEFPDRKDIGGRTDVVLKSVYLMFNEGYSTSGGESPVRNDLCFEAIRLASILRSHPLTRAPKVDALLALFYFQTARLAARFDSNGDILRMSEQDRSTWDRRLVSAGLRALKASASGDELSQYHIEAEIASIHSVAADFESTDWRRLVECYDLLMRIAPSPIVRLNRAIAVSRVSGPKAATAELIPIADELEGYPLYHITVGELLSKIGDQAGAAEAWSRAGKLSGNDAMYRFLRRRKKKVWNNRRVIR